MLAPKHLLALRHQVYQDGKPQDETYLIKALAAAKRAGESATFGEPLKAVDRALKHYIEVWVEFANVQICEAKPRPSFPPLTKDEKRRVIKSLYDAEGELWGAIDAVTTEVAVFTRASSAGKGAADGAGGAAPRQLPADAVSAEQIGGGGTKDEFKYDVFVCHASEDKQAVVVPLTNELTKRGLRVWVDYKELRLGDNLRARIDEGLCRSRFGLVILSPRFFAKPWPRAELDGLVALEMADGKKRVLPIWHEVEEADVAQQSPTLAARLAARWEDGLPQVVEKIILAVRD